MILSILVKFNKHCPLFFFPCCLSQNKVQPWQRFTVWRKHADCKGCYPACDDFTNGWWGVCPLILGTLSKVAILPTERLRVLGQRFGKNSYSLWEAPSTFSIRRRVQSAYNNNHHSNIKRSRSLFSSHFTDVAIALLSKPLFFSSSCQLPHGLSWALLSGFWDLVHLVCIAFVFQRIWSFLGSPAYSPISCMFAVLSFF